MRHIAPLYDAFILDQWGVLHDGTDAMPGGPECLAQLGAAGKKLIILSNDGARKKGGMTGVSKLEGMGYDASVLMGSVLAGEEAIQWMLREYAGRKLKASWFAWSRTGFEASYIDGLDVELVAPGEAEVIIAQGTARLLTSDADRAAEPVRNLQYSKTGEIDEVAQYLREAADNDALMVCCNPDIKTVKRGKDGAEVPEFTPGGLARFYESVGGRVEYFGKPHKQHFEACLRELGVAKDRVAMVGDALETDILGANTTGIASVLVASGIHGAALGCTDLAGDKLPTAEDLARLCEEFGGVRPDHVLPRFVW